MQPTIITYAICINVVAFILCVYDKRAAIKRKRRIRERTLFAVSIFGGALGMFIAMLLVRHKTRHWSFMLFIPLFAIGHIALYVYLFI